MSMMINTGTNYLKLLSSTSTSTICRSLLGNNSFFRQNRYFTTTNTTTTTNTIKDKLITTPIFYVNGYPHIGHLYTALLGDSLNRWHKFNGHKTMFVTGTDEHGTKVYNAATKLNKQPIDYCNEISSTFKVLFDKSNIKYDQFIRTTDDRHKVAVQNMWRELESKGLIYKGYYEGWYCVSDEAFLTNDQVEEGMSPITPTNPISKKTMISKESGNVVEWVKEENYLFKLSSFIKQIDYWLDKDQQDNNSNNIRIIPRQRLHDAKRYLEGMNDLSISRPSSRIPWGIKVPGDDSQTIYVWLDALTNYLTVTGYPTNNGAKNWNDTDILHIIGKDIVKFHTVYWPAFLIGAGHKAPDRVLAHSHWTVNRVKMSKSLGNVVDPTESIDKYGLDTIRYFLLRSGGLEDDGDWSDYEVIMKLNSELADTFGNLVSRSVAKALHPSGHFPTKPSQQDYQPADLELIQQLEQLPMKVSQHINSQLVMRGGIMEIFQFLFTCNKYVTDVAPWTLVPKPNKQIKGDLQRLNTIMYLLMESIRISTLLLTPIIPDSSALILDRLQISIEKRTFKHLSYGHEYPKDIKMDQNPLVLFKKMIEPPLNSQ